MKFHKEGYPTLIVTIIFAIILVGLTANFAPDIIWLQAISWAISIFLLVVVLQFFRSPGKVIQRHDNHIIAPADGKVVVIEETVENEYFKDKRLQISIFMSPINVHVNRYPVGGEVKYAKYHPGLFLVAWHPKSSTDNERTTIVVEDANKRQIMFRQIAGALARRIVFYCKAGDIAQQGEEFGFIKFGSRVDLLLPPSVKVNVALGQKVTGGKTVIATFS